MKTHKLPCDVKVGHIVFKKGVSLCTLVDAANRWHAEAVELYEMKIPDKNRVERIRDFIEGVPGG